METLTYIPYIYPIAHLPSLLPYPACMGVAVSKLYGLSSSIWAEGEVWKGNEHTCGERWNGVIWCEMEWCDMVRDDMKWYDMVWYEMVWYGKVWYDVVWYDI